MLTRLPLRARLLLALVVPAGLVVLVVVSRAEAVAGRALEAALAARLVAAARAAAAVLPARVMALGPGDDGTRTKRNALEKLDELRAATGVAQLLLVRADTDTVLLDTREALPIGVPYRRAALDRFELEVVLTGSSTASVLFEGPAGRPYKTGYAPLQVRGEVAGYLAAVAPADYTAALDALRLRLLAVGGTGLLLLVALAVVTASLFARPLGALSASARQIGQGDLTASVPITGPAETRLLGRTMRDMAASLRARDDELQMMLAGIAHEVRNPLGGIELFGGLLREDLEGDPRRAHVDKILRELGVLSRVVSEFLDFARRRELEIGPVDLPDLFFELAGLAEAEAGSRGVKLTLAPPEPAAARFDRPAVQRALLNLTRNAQQAARSEVQVSARARGEDLELVVDDDGPGIPEPDRARVLAPFFTTKEKGTGLGLALAHRTALAHGGELRVEDAPLGGARVVLALPRALAR